ncbi:hypothetical protein JCM10914A_42740 [Paenibacillus sp. JCM 10914]|uniref:hypothetical protein n=1 Tax=Paenibacillus sp. JCM 10914 TaxID=1236974 RepID=UPI0003CCBA01|nr:hypothetical protein [Paenibacillus sp. JCM 10914]GAE05492.1 hypothetical protein JCM10914_1595 [Paenibacillus sp. JCM 10914]
MPSRRRRVRKSKHADVQQWVGQPVVIILKDGSSYIGELNGIQGQEVTISGYRVHQKMPTAIADSGDRAQISGFFDFLFGGASNAPAGEAGAEGQSAAGGGGAFGFIGQMMPHITMGMKVIKTIMPLMSMFKI